MPAQSSIADKMHELAREGFAHQFGKPKITGPSNPQWARHRALGTRLWLDTGDLEEATRLWAAEFDALTTNNTLLNKEIQKGLYDDRIPRVAAELKKIRPQIRGQELALEIAFYLNAFHALRLVEQFDANVSVELHTDLSNDVERTVEYGRRYYAICPERFYIKVPLTPAGLLGARRLVLDGIPVNFTLGFSARQNYLIALLTKPAFVNVFMGRLNSFVADHKLGDGNNVGEKATLATQRELRLLRQTGRTSSKLIGASMRGAGQVDALAGLDVYTMPTKVAAEYAKLPEHEISPRIDDDPPVELSPGVTLGDFNGATLWDVPREFKDCVNQLLLHDPATRQPEDIIEHFSHGGFGDLFPRWTVEDVTTIMQDGKIPIYNSWKKALGNGSVGLDALMNVSALYSFVTDQTALDDRVRAMLG